MLVSTTAFAAKPSPGAKTAPWQSLVHKPGAVAYQHTYYLSEVIGSRVAGSDKEVEARDYIEGQFKRLGFETEVKEFSYTRKDVSYDSANVIAVKPGKSKEVVIVGAHYDSVGVGKGADDNASAVGVMLEVAEVLRRVPTPYTIIFIAFGAEEVGLRGSREYVNKMSDDEIENTVAMINLDSLIAGDKMYVHGGIATDWDGNQYGSEEDGWVRDQALYIAERYKLNLETNPGLDVFGLFPEGTTGTWSNHFPFAAAGIPFAYFEATNWEIDDMDGYTQTEEHGSYWHTSKDTLGDIERDFPGRVEERLSTFSVVLRDVLKLMNKTSIARKAA